MTMTDIVKLMKFKTLKYIQALYESPRPKHWAIIVADVVSRAIPKTLQNPRMFIRMIYAA